MISKPANLKKWLLVAIVISFMLKMAAGFYLKDSFLRRGNSHTPMNAIAFNLADNGSFQLVEGIPSIDYEPLYPGLMAASYIMFGKNWFGLTLFQGILFALSGWLLYLIGSRFFNERAGFIAALYHSFYPYLFSYSLSIYDTTLFVFLYLLLIHLLVQEKDTLFRLAGAGMVLGLALLTRASIIAFIPAIFLYVLLKNWKRCGIWKIAGKLALIILFCLLTVSPWLLRNNSLSGAWVISTHGSFGLWQGNNEHSYRLLKNDISLDEVCRMKPWPDVYSRFPMTARHPRQALHVSRVYRNAAWTFIKRSPKEFFRLALLKFIKFWSWRRNPASSSLAFGSNRLREIIFFISYFPLLLSLPFGLWLLLKRKRNEFHLIGSMLILFTLSHMVAMGFTRARVPIDPLLMLLAGVNLSFFISKNDKKPEAPFA